MNNVRWDTNGKLALIVREYQCQGDKGFAPRIDSFVSRFPELEQLFQFCRCLLRLLPVPREDQPRELQKFVDVNTIRLVQAAFHNRSLSLYARLGFIAREPLSTMQGPALGVHIPGYSTRPATELDLGTCNEICAKVHGHDRAGELRDAIKETTATVVEHAGRIVGYSSSIAFFGHAVAETNEGLKALIAAAPAFGGPGFLVPTRNAELFLWCLERGLRVVQPMTLMSIGLYNEPAGAFLPSILY